MPWLQGHAETNAQPNDPRGSYWSQPQTHGPVSCAEVQLNGINRVHDNRRCFRGDNRDHPPRLRAGFHPAHDIVRGEFRNPTGAIG